MHSIDDEEENVTDNVSDDLINSAATVHLISKDQEGGGDWV